MTDIDRRAREGLEAFGTLEAFVDHLRAKPEIVGLVQYGSRDYRDDDPGGDWDVVVIVDDAAATDVGGLSMVVAGIPVDCMVRSWSDLERTEPLTPFDTLVLEGEVIHDPSGRLVSQLAAARSRAGWQRARSGEASFHFDRFAQRHVLHKVEHRLESEPLYASFLLHANMLWLVETYIEIHRLDIGNYRAAIAHLARHEPALHEAFVAFHETRDLRRQRDLTESLAEAILAPVGGLWSGEGVHVHWRDASGPPSPAAIHRTVELLI